MKKSVILTAACLLLAACTTQAPFVDARREASKSYTVGESTPDVVAVCFNKYSTHSSEIIRMAQEECRKTNREAKYKGMKRWSCRVLLPHRVYFECADAPLEDGVVAKAPLFKSGESGEEPLVRMSVDESPAK